MFTPLARKPPSLLPRASVSGHGKVLVVDDEPSICRFIEAALRSAGFEEIVTCASGSAVPTLALSERPQLIIMDVMMPGGNGMRALRALKRTPATAGIPVIITSGFALPALDECPQNRADRVLAKPFTVEQLLKAVGQLTTP